MDFNTPIFLFLFLPAFLMVYFSADRRWRRLVGIAGSLVFLSQGQFEYLLLMIGLIILNYWTARLIQDDHTPARTSRLFLTGGIVLNLIVLACFKSLVSFGVGWLTQSGLPVPHLVLDWLETAKFPLGLSYTTFQLISYLVDVARGAIPAEKDILNFSFYVLFFPKIPSGPIVRYKTMAGQLREPEISREGIASGIRRFIQGFAKKALIADTLEKIVGVAFHLGAPGLSPPLAWFAVACFALQVYFDFSGFTDMALGLGRMMGFALIENFNYPYIAQSLGDFWRRWHISLSTWFRDYVFYPIERRRIKYVGQPLNILVVFLLTGLWHGFSGNFVLWGLWQGFFIALENLFLGRLLARLPRLLRHVYFLLVVLLGWVWFRSPSPRFAFEFIQRLLGNTKGVLTLPFLETTPLPIIDPTVWMAFGAGILLSLPLLPGLEAGYRRWLKARPSAALPVQVLFDVLLLFLLVAAIAITASNDFAPGIYRNF